MLKSGLIKIISWGFAGVIAVSAIAGGVYLYTASQRLKSIQLNPDFNEFALDTGKQYTFSIATTPQKANISKANFIINDPTCLFEFSDNRKAILTTGKNETNISLYIECDGIKSDVLTFNIVDFDAKAQAEAAEKAKAEAQIKEKKEQEEAESNSNESEKDNIKKHVEVIGDNVNIRSINSTDGDVLGKAKKGDLYEKIEDVDDWTLIKYNDQDGYMKTEFLSEISEEEYSEKSVSSESSNNENNNEKINTDNSTISNAESATPESSTIAEATNTSSSPQIINKTFSAKLSEFQYNPTYNRYEKNEVFELKVGDTLNYSVCVTNDTGKLFSPAGGSMLSNSVPLEDNLNINVIYPGTSQTSVKGTITKSTVDQGEIYQSYSEANDPQSIANLEDMYSFQYLVGPSYNYIIKVNWVK